MEIKTKCMLSMFVLAFLVGCDCGSDKKDVLTDTQVIEDSALRGTASDFIANAGDRVFFNFDKSDLTPEAKATLDRQVDWLKTHNHVTILIEGHCDERGTREYNQGLGLKRANAISEYLQSKGIDQSRFRVVSYGKDRPIAVKGTKEEFYRINRVGISVIDGNLAK